MEALKHSDSAAISGILPQTLIGKGWSLGLKIYGKVGTPRLLRTIRRQSVKFGQGSACWRARIAFRK